MGMRCPVMHFNVTENPSSDWVIEQLREAFPDTSPYRYVILDRDSIFSAEVIAFLKAAGLSPSQPVSSRPGRTGLRKGGLEAAGERLSTTSSHSTSCICGAF